MQYVIVRRDHLLIVYAGKEWADMAKVNNKLVMPVDPKEVYTPKQAKNG